MVAKNEHHLKSQCPIACALDIIGDHWTLLIIRDLVFKEKHEYKEFLDSEEGISSNILTNRLKKLEAYGIIAVAQHPESRLRKLYFLTSKGKDLISVMLELARWADRQLGDRIFIPEEKRLLLDKPTKEVEKMLHQRMEKWEKEHLD